MRWPKILLLSLSQETSRYRRSPTDNRFSIVSRSSQIYSNNKTKLFVVKRGIINAKSHISSAGEIKVSDILTGAIGNASKMMK